MKKNYFLLTISFLFLTIFISCVEKPTTSDSPPTSNSNPTTILYSHQVSINENPVAGLSLGTMTLTTTGNIKVFAITSQTPSGALRIDSASGELFVQNPNLFDYETRTSITANVEVTIDNSTKDSATVTITLLDVNDSPSTVNLDDFQVSINENPTADLSLGAMTLTTTGNTKVFAITSQTPAGALRVDSASGELFVQNPALFDYETRTSITANVEVTIDNSTKDSATVTITLLDVNDSPPTVNLDDFQVSINENPPTSISLGTMTLATTGNTKVFTITSQTPAGALKIDSTSGELFVKDATFFDYETRTSITANVEASVAYTGGSVEDTATVTITLLDINESTSYPATLDDFQVSINENPATNLSLGTMRLTTSGGTTKYFIITSQTPVKALRIDSASGELFVKDPTLFDYETRTAITANVEVTVDNNTKATATVTIDLLDVNDAPPTTTATLDDFQVSINENPATNLSLGTMTLNHTGGNPKFALNTQNPIGALRIDPNSGELFVKDATFFDYETRTAITAKVTVSVAYTGGRVEDTATVTINLIDINDTTTTLDNFQVSINENPTADLSLGTMTLTTTGNTKVFTITSQTPTDALRIDSASGELFVKTPALFDYETRTSITASVEVTVDGTTTDTATATITLTDINETSKTIWTGTKITFTKADGTDSSLEANQDRITSNVWITRGCCGAKYNPRSGIIYNAKTESSPSKSTSPSDTEWSIGTTANLESLTFQPFNSVGLPLNLINVDLVLHLITDNIYIDIKITSWSKTTDNGGFTYKRSTPAP